MDSVPDIIQAWRKAQMATNPDKQGNMPIALDGTDMARITAILTASRDMCLRFLGIATADDNPCELTAEDEMAIEQVEAPLDADELAERNELMLNVWLQVRYRFQQAMVIRSNRFAFHHMALMVDQASEELRRLEPDES